MHFSLFSGKPSGHSRLLMLARKYCPDLRGKRVLAGGDDTGKLTDYLIAEFGANAHGIDKRNSRFNSKLSAVRQNRVLQGDLLNLEQHFGNEGFDVIFTHDVVSTAGQIVGRWPRLWRHSASWRQNWSAKRVALFDRMDRRVRNTIAPRLHAALLRQLRPGGIIIHTVRQREELGMTQRRFERLGYRVLHLTANEAVLSRANDPPPRIEALSER